jgi:hypothetical protein
LGQDRFDFSALHIENTCETLGCAIGEMPFAFPEDWEYKQFFPPMGSIIPVLKNSKTDSSFEDSKEYFNIRENINDHLFCPGLQISYLGKFLSSNSSKEDVAENILRYCKTLEKGRKKSTNGKKSKNR